MTRVYLDQIAASAVRPEVLEAMLPFFRERFGNAQSLHAEGQIAQEAVAEARESMARLLNAKAEEIYFVSCGSEANNLAVKGMAMAAKPKGGHIVLSAIEHVSVLNAAKSLEKMGFITTLVPVDAEARVDPAAVAAALRPDTALVSIQLANSEVGTIQPAAEMIRLVKAKGVLVHMDAVAAVGHIPVDVRALGVDALSLAGDQFDAPKGSGALFLRKGVKILPLIDGGVQEGGKRGGTENVPAIVGLGQAAEIARAGLDDRVAALTALRDRLIAELPARIPHVLLTGAREKRLPHHASFAVRFVEGEAMLLSLDMKGIAASSGSACTSKSLKASHVQLAMGLDHAAANGSIVFSLPSDATAAGIEYLLDVFPPIIDRLRKMSPLYTEFLKENAR
ncbi:MAG: aminotransferase class V-fold PLP-dependent enzyme [Candidatus Aminicenantes bacterium]|nr:aminotransferase class V-fold PLP-dependent enzyme [Candidatus Aminicenantes bacterium]